MFADEKSHLASSPGWAYNRVPGASAKWLCGKYTLCGKECQIERHAGQTARIRTRLLTEGKITREMIESYVGAYGDDMDAYLEEIMADAYAGMNRTDYGTNQLRADVQMEVGQWKKKTGRARAPPAKYSIEKTTENRPFVEVEQDIFDSVQESEWVSTVKENLKKKFPSGITVGRVGKRDNGSMVLYDVLNLQTTSFTEKETNAAITTNPSPGAGRSTASVSETNIRSGDETVKTKRARKSGPRRKTRGHGDRWVGQ